MGARAPEARRVRPKATGRSGSCPSHRRLGWLMSESLASPNRMARVRVIAHSLTRMARVRAIADSDGSCPSIADSDGSCPSHRRLEPGRLPVPGRAPALPAIYTTVTDTVTVTVTDRLSGWCAVTQDSGPLPRPCPPLPQPALKVPGAWLQSRPSSPPGPATDLKVGAQ